MFYRPGYIYASTPMKLLVIKFDIPCNSLKQVVLIRKFRHLFFQWDRIYPAKVSYKVRPNFISIARMI